MKKFVVLTVLSLLMLFSPVSNICFAASEIPLTQDPAILQNVIGRLMIWDIQKAANDYYSEYTDYLPQIEVYAPTSSTEILNITYDNSNNIYTIKIKIEPYVAAHNQIGEDIITFEITGSADVTVKDFEHVKSYEYPPWLEVKLKKFFPPDKA